MIEATLNYLLMHYLQILKFVVVGVTTFFINLSFFHLFFGVLNIDYEIAISFSYLITVLSHFTLHRVFTFNVKNQFLTGNAVKYLGMLGLNYVITLTAMWLVVNVATYSPYFGVIASTGLTAFTSFFVMKYFVFNKRDSL
jgi:putative flippase GtrA